MSSIHPTSMVANVAAIPHSAQVIGFRQVVSCSAGWVCLPNRLVTDQAMLSIREVNNTDGFGPTFHVNLIPHNRLPTIGQ